MRLRLETETASLAFGYRLQLTVTWCWCPRLALPQLFFSVFQGDPGLDAIDVTIQQIREHFHQTKKTTGVALKNHVIGVSIGCKLLSVEGQEQEDIKSPIYHGDLISKRLGTRGMQVLDQES